MSGLDGGELAVPLFDHGALDFQPAKLEELRGERALADAVRFRFAFGAKRVSFPVELAALIRT
ncbi:MAG TPA: hypothetical protein VOA78_10085 [Candidatus Dormibacteraeota bacterium]|nr:hypothetical protein [Candidatus Dormibacteraeota bacterium]